MVKPMKTLELHYPMVQFLIISGIPQFYLGNIRSRDALRPIASERKYLMDCNIESRWSLVFSFYTHGPLAECIYQENTSDWWNFPLYTTTERCISTI